LQKAWRSSLREKNEKLKSALHRVVGQFEIVGNRIVQFIRISPDVFLDVFLFNNNAINFDFWMTDKAFIHLAAKIQFLRRGCR
jgi:hypothetical protein